MITVTILSISLNARKFFEFQLNHDNTDYETTSLMEYPPYIVFSNTWQELIVTGALPFLVLIICNINIYLKIRESSKHENHRFVKIIVISKSNVNFAKNVRTLQIVLLQICRR